jgi:hypothetical protein
MGSPKPTCIIEGKGSRGQHFHSPQKWILRVGEEHSMDLSHKIAISSFESDSNLKRPGLGIRELLL